MKLFDYGKSFILTDNGGANSPRFLIDARCTLIKKGGTEEYFLCSPCIGENTFSSGGLFEETTPFEFTPIIGKDQSLVFRKFKFFNHNEISEYKQAYQDKDLWGNKNILIKDVEPKEILNTTEKIIKATKDGLPIMGRLVFKDTAITIIDFPIKTMNTLEDKWQVDTGPIPFPDKLDNYSVSIFSFFLANIVFNNFKSVEVMLNELTSITDRYLIVHPNRVVKVNNPEIYLYSL